MIGLFALIAAALAPIPSPADEPAPVPAPAAARIEIPFDPPLGEALRYRLSRIENRNGQPHAVSLDMWVTFARDGDAFVMTTRTEAPPGLPAIPSMAATMALLTRPYSLRVSAAGEIVGLVDEAGYWAALDRALAELGRAMPDPAGRRAAEAAIARIRALPRDELLALLSQNVSPILEFSATGMTPGETLRANDERQSVLGPISQETSATIEDSGRRHGAGHPGHDGPRRPAVAQCPPLFRRDRPRPTAPRGTPPLRLRGAAELHRLAADGASGKLGYDADDRDPNSGRAEPDRRLQGAETLEVI